MKTIQEDARCLVQWVEDTATIKFFVEKTNPRNHIEIREISTGKTTKKRIK